uniref:PARP-type domain-containing protein n=1 Tax=Alexandrium monilatum TaxID=311494 RepID=A0A7S4SRN8_9DINO|mmetsp:Transcript_110106/g.351223  ORF Transcript_110106/g.351223 Transcript_110106/m.351223 type:complete len:569 (-) Transcript_110106:129-1835(-)
MAEKPYRVEAAPSGRSTCTISKAKIEKGELRLGSFVSFGGKGSYKWRRLSCITAKQAANIEKELGGPEHLDGFAELGPEQRAAVVAAFECAAKGPAEAPAAPGAEDECLPPAKKARVDAAPKPKAKAKGKAKAKAAISGAPDGIPLTSPSASPTSAPDALQLAHAAIDMAKAGAWDSLYGVLDKQQDLVNARPHVREYSVLHQAAFHGSLDVVRRLIEKYGADPSKPTKFGKSVAEIAEEQGHAPVVDFLAQRLGATAPKGKADVGVDLTPEKMPKVDKASAYAGNQAPEAAKAACATGAQPALAPALIHTAHRAIDLAKMGQWEDLFTLLDFRKDIVNVRPEVRDYAVLHQAAYHGDRGAVGTLVGKHGADPAQRTRSGKTAAEVAREHGHAEVAAALEEHSARAPRAAGAAPRAGPEEEAEEASDFHLLQMPDGTWKVKPAGGGPAAPAGRAAPGGPDPDAVQAAPPDAVGAAHRVIDMAKAARWGELYRLLDAQPELVNVRPDVREFSALHQAAYHGNGEAVATLINKYGADPAQKTRLGVSAAVIALGQGHLQVADFIAARLPA